MAESVDVGRLASLRRDVARNAARARNGVKWATGSEWAPLNPTPSDVIWRRGKAHVRHYRRDTPPRYSVPVVAYLGLVGTVLTFPLYSMLLRDWGPGRAAYNSVLIPVVAMALSTLFEGYHWTTLAVGGAGLALAGLTVALGRRR